MERFNAIVVGGGPAGAAAAHHLASAGLSVVLIERGVAAGTKNVSGALLYADPVTGTWPEFLDGAPLERRITSHRLVMLADRKAVAVGYEGDEAEKRHGVYTVMRTRFDPWLAKRAEETGAALITGVNVDGLLLDGTRVVGVRAGTDRLEADVVVVADGAKSLLLREAGLRDEFDAHDVAIGVKEIIGLAPETIEERFGCSRDGGVAYTMVGATAGVEGGAFLYTNRASLSLGAVVKIDSLAASGLRPHEVLDEVKSHPLISRLIEGGTVLEYSAQAIHRGRYAPTTRLCGDGYVTVGSAGRLLINNVLTLRGIDFAIVSGIMAARAITEASRQDQYDRASLSVYESLLKQTAVYSDWKTFRDSYPLMDNPRLFGAYPEIACSVMEQLLSPCQKPGRKALAATRRAMRGRMSMLDVGHDLIDAARGLVL